MKAVSRRRFLQSTGTIAAASMAARPAHRAQGADSANERINAALIGCGSQGRDDARALLQAGSPNVVIAALADVDERRVQQCADVLQESQKVRPECYGDFRRIIDRKDIDVLIVATPDHWHAACTLLAIQSGKDVYVEKPCSHNIREGRAMVDAARKHKRIVQVGQHQRSDPHFREAMEYLRNGKPLGAISRTITFNYSNEAPDGIGNPPDTAPPPGVDYDRWLGPAPQRPFNPNRFHYTFRWFYDYAAGMIGDWNVHLQDIVHWGMNVQAPRSVCAMGGKAVLKDNRDTPDVMDVLYEYPGFTHVYTMGKCYHKGSYPNDYGVEFFGSDGSLFIDRGGWEVRPEMNDENVDDPDRPGKTRTIQKPRTPSIKKEGGDSLLPHFQNFLECVRSRKIEDLHADIEVGHRTATVCHLGNIALRLGKRIYWDSEKEVITLQDGTVDSAANAWLTREYRKNYTLPSV